MKKILKITFLALPISLLILFLVYNIIQRSFVNRKMYDANGIVWKDEKVKYKFDVKKTNPDGETVLYTIQIINTETNTLSFQREISFDFDMFGGGFTKAIQVDSDPEMEVVAWGAHERGKNFILDFTNGTIEEVPFANASFEVKELVQQWHTYNVMKPMEFSIFIFILAGYYISYVAIRVIVKLINKTRKIKISRKAQ